MLARWVKTRLYGRKTLARISDKRREEVSMADIKHVVVLMLENRSFDSMLGRLYPGRPDFDGLSEKETNKWNGQSVPVWASPSMTPDVACIPTPDPNELFADMTDQIFGAGSHPPSPANMSGFAANYMKTATNDPKSVMHGFTPDQVPVISTLAKSFGVSDRWHASAPNQPHSTSDAERSASSP
jgi:phospholipase C